MNEADRKYLEDLECDHEGNILPREIRICKMSVNKNANLRQTTEAEIVQDIFGYDETTENAIERVVDESLDEPIAGPSAEPSASTSVQKVIIETCTQLQKHMKTLMGVVGADKENTEEDTVELMPKMRGPNK